jgi:mono/diheme cytochrome c family protein
MISRLILARGWTMPIKKSTGLALAGLLLLAVGSAPLVGQEGRTAQGKELKLVSVHYSQPTSGAQMYKNYCAVCHGMQGNGDGPAVAFLKAPPPDLRTLAKRNNGKYPADHIGMTLRLGTGSHAHGTIDMPLWGPLLRTLDVNQSLGELRIHNLTAFIKSLQSGSGKEGWGNGKPN